MLGWLRHLWSAPGEALADLFWSIATTNLTLAVIGALLLAALVVGYFPLLRWFPIIGQYVATARLVAALSACLLFFLIGFRISDDRAEAKSLRLKLAATQIDLGAANDAARKADEARAELAQQAEQDQQRISDYAEQLKKRPNGACTLGPDDFDGLRNGR